MKYKNVSRKYGYILFLFLIFLFKLLLILLFSSDYQERLFLPFLGEALEKFPSDPWRLTIEKGQRDAFPYHPVLLYVLGLFQILPVSLGASIWIARIFLSIPSFLADLILLFVTVQFFPNRKKAIAGVYFFSPIILYAVYMHGQLDLLPTSFLFLTLYWLVRNQYIYAGVSFALAVSMKLHVITAFPMFLFYIYRKDRKNILGFSSSAFVLFAILSLPWYFSPYFRQAVLFNPKQELLFFTIYKIGDFKLLIPIFAVLLVYFKFFSYRKVNQDLLVTWLAILFSIFVLTIPPAPGWYVWTLPFLVYFYLKFLKKNKHMLYLGGLLNLSFLFFFLFAWKGDYLDLKFLGEEILFKFKNEKIQGFLFTGLSASLIANLYAVYELGVRSNRIYHKPTGFLIGIGGDSGAGKSTLLHSLAKLLSHSVTLLEGDGDHRWERGNQNYEKFTHLNPRANYLERQAENLYLLKKGEIIYRPDYDHNTGKFTEPQPVYPSEYIILSGLHSFYLPKMRKVMDLKIFIDTEESLRRHWKILRDTKKRGYSIEKILEQIAQREDDSRKYIQPQKQFADMIVEYFSHSAFVVGQIDTEIHINLKITLLSEFILESLAIELEEKDYLIEWNYMDDLQRQYFIFHEPIPKDGLDTLVDTYIPNVEELVQKEIHWEEGYSGTIQFFTLLLIHQKLMDTKEQLL